MNTKGIALAAALLLAYPARAQTVTANDFQLLGPDGMVKARLAFSAEGSPSLFIMDQAGRARLVAGVYKDGMPCLVLNDEMGRAAGIFRLAGSKQSPVLVLKSAGRDRLVLGLNMEDALQQPFVDLHGDKLEGGWPEGGGMGRWLVPLLSAMLGSIFTVIAARFLS